MDLKSCSLHQLARRFARLGVAYLTLAGCGGNHLIVPQISWAAPAPIPYGVALSAAQLNATADIPGTFSYSPSTGTVPSAGSPTLSVTFTPTDTATYATVTASVALTVNPLPTTVNWSTPAAITYGAALSAKQLNATASLPGTFTYTPSLGSIPSAGSDKLSVTFSPTNTNYATATASVILSVSQATPRITWNTPVPITYQTALGTGQLNATANVPGTFAYSPSQGSVISAGTTPLSVTFTPADTADYTSATAGVILTVNQATPHITWAPTALIAVGAPLSSGQLNASATLPPGTTVLAGSYAYSPAAGTIFNSPGPVALSVTFTPYDTVDYTTASANLNLTASTFGVVGWGDSITSGDEGIHNIGNYPSDLQKLITLPVVNMGVRGQTSTEIGVREGGVPAVVSVEGGVIPSTGGVTVTFPTCAASNCPSYKPVNSLGPTGGVSGTILGVHGTVTIDSTGTIFKFTRTNSGNAVNASGTPQFIVDTPYASYIPIFWEGRNDFLWTAQILSDLTKQVATVPAGQDYLVLSILNENRPAEWRKSDWNAEGVQYDWLIPFNEQLRAIYGSHYLDIRKVLVDNYDPTQASDVADYIHDEPPTSLREIGIETTLVNAIGPTDTVLTLNCSTSNWGAGAILTIDTGAIAENVQIVTASGNTVTVVRNFGMTSSSHAAGAPMTVTGVVHLNAKGAQIVANTVAQYFTGYLR